MLLTETLVNSPHLFVRQQLELGEFLGFETRNKYEILSQEGASVGFAAEQQKGLFGFLMRHFLGHWRAFDIIIFDQKRMPVLLARHPFRFLFQRIEVYHMSGESVGTLQQRFSLLSKRFDVHDARGRLLMEMRSPLWRVWTFFFYRNAAEVARVEKKWSGLLSEAFTDRDNFRVQFAPGLAAIERSLVLAGAIFIDLNYFERKAK